MLYDNSQLALKRLVEGTTLRQSALSANLANANTPGYRRVDVNFHGALDAAIASGNRGALERIRFNTEVDASRALTRQDGSTVDIDTESAMLAQNALEHQAAVQVLMARESIVKIAMGVQ